MVKNFHHKIIFLIYTNAVVKHVLSQQERQNNKVQLSTHFTYYSSFFFSNLYYFLLFLGGGGGGGRNEHLSSKRSFERISILYNMVFDLTFRSTANSIHCMLTIQF